MLLPNWMAYLALRPRSVDIRCRSHWRLVIGTLGNNLSDLVTDQTGWSHFIAPVVGHESCRSSQNALCYQQVFKRAGYVLRGAASANYASARWAQRSCQSPDFYCRAFNQSSGANNRPRYALLLNSLVHHNERVLGLLSSTQTAALLSAQTVARPTTVSRADARNRSTLATGASGSQKLAMQPQVVSGTRSLKRKRAVKDDDSIDLTIPSRENGTLARARRSLRKAAS